MVYPNRKKMTRYPKTGKGTKWTAKELDSIKAAWVGDMLNDSESMIGDVVQSQSGSISIKFKFGYKLDKKKKWFYCGTYPHTSLAEIRVQTLADAFLELDMFEMQCLMAKMNENMDKVSGVE